MRYLPHTPEEIEVMLAAVGAGNLAELFAAIPADCLMTDAWPLPKAMSEWQLDAHMRSLAGAMGVDENAKVLIGAGSYHHHIPATVKSLAGRSEFLTAYTPYQPEMAQGTLQGIFEYQTLTARLLGVDVVNASMYDGASALAEGLLMALRIGRKRRCVAVSKAIHPHWRAVIRAYLAPAGFTILELDVQADGRTDLTSLDTLEDLAALALQSPNFFGVIEDLAAAADGVHGLGGLLVAAFSEPLAFGLFRSPGECGADIVCGEGQSFGIPRSFGGPYLGMFGCKEPFVRAMPGRLVGETTDIDGRRGYVLTLATREQHIRREKATSNICSNQGICAMTAGMYMASLGGTGLRRLARVNYDQASYFRAQLTAAGARVVFSGPVFNEFVARLPGDPAALDRRLRARGIIAGLELGRYYTELDGCRLFCVTETTDKQTMDTIVAEVRS